MGFDPWNCPLQIQESIGIPTPCRNPSLEFATKARCDKVVGQEGDTGVISHAPGSANSVRE
jgi:hypothetical protein